MRLIFGYYHSGEVILIYSDKLLTGNKWVQSVSVRRDLIKGKYSANNPVAAMSTKVDLSWISVTQNSTKVDFVFFMCVSETSEFEIKILILIFNFMTEFHTRKQ